MCGGYSLVRKRTFTGAGVLECWLIGIRNLWVSSQYSITPLLQRSIDKLSLHFQQQHRHIDFVAHFIGRRAVENVADEPVAVRGHRNQINYFLAREFDDLVGGLAKSEDGIAGKTLCGQFTAAFFQVKAVLFHFFALRELELIEIARHPAVGHMDQKQFRTGHSRQRFDMRENGLIGWAVLERDEDMVIHVRNDEAP